MRKKILFLCLIILLFGSAVVEARMQSANYQINADVVSAGGVLSSSADFGLEDTVGESVIGTGSSVNYVLKDGFWQMVNTYLIFTIDADTVNFGALTPGTPLTAQNILTVLTDSWNGYTLSISKNHRLRHTDGSTEIPDHNGTIAVPLAWSAPNNLGLGFTVSAGTGVDSKWGGGSKFAAVPTGTSEVFHTRDGYRSSADQTVVDYKLDVPATQKSGVYAAVVTYTAMPAL